MEPSRFDPTIVSSARRYNYWLGGKDNFKADRVSGDEIAKVLPLIRTAAIENRLFMRRAVRFLAAQGIHQFIDIGTGIPMPPNVHEIAQQVDPTASVVYVDNDPIVLSHARVWMSTGNAFINGDLREPSKILAAPELSILDLTQPVALLLVAVVHFLGDDDNPREAINMLFDTLPAGSALVLSHGTVDPLPIEVAEHVRTMGKRDSEHGLFRPRSYLEVASLVYPSKLVDPGLVSIVNWRPDMEPRPGAGVLPEDVCFYGMVALKE